MHSSRINGEGELRGQLANPGSPGKMAAKMECVCVIVPIDGCVGFQLKEGKETQRLKSYSNYYQLVSGSVRVESKNAANWVKCCMMMQQERGVISATSNETGSRRISSPYSPTLVTASGKILKKKTAQKTFIILAFYQCLEYTVQLN